MIAVREFYLMVIKKPFQTFKPNEVYWIDWNNMQMVNPKHADFIPSDVIQPFKDQENLLIVRSGGIGDLLALSVLQDVAKITFLTHKNLFPVLDWWQKPPTKKAFARPIFNLRPGQKIEDVVKNWGILKGEDQIELGSHENWYEIFWKAASREPGAGRPQLKESKRSGSIPCLIVDKASSINRSAEYKIIEKVAHEFFHYAGFIEQTTTEKYLENLERAKFVISVDTSAIHFREGIGKPALGLYSSFTTDARTKDYTYTKSIDIKSECDLQPCFLRNSIRCPKAKPDAACAPCLSSENLTFENQLRNTLKEML